MKTKSSSGCRILTSNYTPENKFKCKLYSKVENNFEVIANEVDSAIYVTAIEHQNMPTSV